MAVFTGALPPKKKSEIQALAVELHLDSGGTKEELIDLIKKHLASNPKLEEDERFAGLYGRGKKKPLTKDPSPEDKILVDAPATSARLTRHKPSSQASLTRSHHAPTTPVHTRQIVNGVAEREEEEDSDPSPARVPLPSSVVVSPTRSIISEYFGKAMAAVAAPDQEAVTQLVQTKSNAAVIEAEKALTSTKAFLSNAKNISSITVLLELFFIVYSIVPWNYYMIPLNAPYTVNPETSIPNQAEQALISTSILRIPYPPTEYLLSSTPYLTFLLWSVPTLIIPQIFGTLISFKHPNSSSQEADPLTAAIMRVACVIAGDWNLGDWSNTLKITGKWRLLSACVACAFAVAEAVGERKKLDQVDGYIHVDDDGSEAGERRRLILSE